MFDDGVLDAEEASIPVIRAGERFAVSSTLYLESNHVAEIEVEINEVGEWLGADYYEHTGQARFDAGDLGLDATGVEVGYGPLNEPVVTFSVDHSGDEPIDLFALYAYVVFRDADGAILGGTFGDVGDPGSARRGSVRIPAGGSIDGEVAVDDPMEIPGIDPSRTEVHLSSNYVL